MSNYLLNSRARAAIVALCVTCGSSALCAQGTPPAPRDSAARRDSTARRDSAASLEAVRITADRVAPPPVPALQLLTLPVSSTVTARTAEQTVNLVDPEDAVKYLPSVFLRKRNYGDTQATVATRVWGVSSSARSLIFADGVPISALIANNNTIGGPRWGLVSPEEISRIDMMYGPYSAAYAGNSMGAVMEISTRQPDSLEASVEQTEALQRFSLYGTTNTFGTAQTNATLGDRVGRFSFWLSGSYQDSHSQPLLYVTSPSFPSGTTGGYAQQNKLGAAADIVGTTGLLHTGMTNAKVKLAYDLTSWLRAAYTFAHWQNDGTSRAESYIDQSGAPTYAGQAGFASGYYNIIEGHTAHSFVLRSNTKKDWDFEAVAALYRFDKDQQRSPLTATAGDTTFGTNGRVAVLDGTGWSSVDLKGAWHRGGPGARHTLTFGVHDDFYRLLNPTYTTADWRGGAVSGVATEGDGNTQTDALWAQDAWRITPALQLTVGARYENWRAYDGFNVNGSTTVHQPDETAARFSPKGVLAWDVTQLWRLTASVGKAYRFATASELYQLVSTGATFTSPDPNLKPDNDLSTELKLQRTFTNGSAQIALFQDDVHDAIISQYLPLVTGSPTLYSYLSNVDHVRATGVEVVLGGTDVFANGLDLSGSVTWLDARTIALSGRASPTAAPGSAIGKFLPNIPALRASFLATYRASAKTAISLAGRYSAKMYTTLDNSDVNTNTYQGFSAWFLLDARVSHQLTPHWNTSLGIDNLLDRKYFLFHPFPQRAVVASIKWSI
ncbi:MAG: TonB-dependent receptor [Gemmatimonadales bacterium]